VDFSDKCANAKNEVDLLKSKKVYLVSHNVFNVILTATYKVSLVNILQEKPLMI